MKKFNLAQLSKYTSPLTAFVCLIFISTFSTLAFASTGSDIFRGLEGDLVATLNGSGKRYIYLAEGLLSLASYIRTKNIMVLFGIVIVSFFFNVVLSVAEMG